MRHRHTSPILRVLFVLGLTVFSLAGNETEPRLKPNDIVQMEVFGQGDLTTSTRIMLSGKAVFPLIGSVKLAELTVAEATESVRGLYAEKYLVDPKVTLTVSEYSSDFVSIIGAVNSPGQVPIPPSRNLDLSTAVAGAGGLAPTADRNRIVINRGGAALTYDAARIERGAPVALQAGDRIVVHQSPLLGKTVTIMGQVGRAGPIPMPLNGELDIVSAIAQAGGFTDLANPRKVNINRGGKITTINVKDMTEQGNTRYLLQPGDIVIVAERWF